MGDILRIMNEAALAATIADVLCDAAYTARIAGGVNGGLPWMELGGYFALALGCLRRVVRAWWDTLDCRHKPGRSLLCPVRQRQTFLVIQRRDPLDQPSAIILQPL
jgi:hypothetical protein